MRVHESEVRLYLSRKKLKYLPTQMSFVDRMGEYKIGNFSKTSRKFGND